METLDVSGIPIEVFTAGSGPPLVYLHAEQFFDRALPHLEALGTRFHVTAPRHPGFGKSVLPPDIRTVEDIAYLYLDLLDQLDLQDVVLVGASLGGWIALEMCVRNSARINKLVLVSSVGVKFASREERDFADLFYLPDEQAFPLLFADPGRWAPDYASASEYELATIARERQQMAYYGWRPYMHNPGLKKWLHRVRMPSLLLWGERDGFVPVAFGRQLAQNLPHAELRIIPRSGHYPQIEQSDAVLRAIEGFARQ